MLIRLQFDPDADANAITTGGGGGGVAAVATAPDAVESDAGDGKTATQTRDSADGAQAAEAANSPAKPAQDPRAVMKQRIKALRSGRDPDALGTGKAADTSLADEPASPQSAQNDADEDTDAKPGTDAASAAASAQTTKELDGARTALKRAHWPDDVLSNMDPQRVLELGRQAKATQAQADNFGNELRQVRQEAEQLKQQLAQQTASKQPSNDDTAVAPPGGAEARSEPTAASGDADAFGQYLRELADDPFNGDLAEPLTKLHAGMQAEHQAQLAAATTAAKQRDDEIQGLYHTLDRLMLSEQRRSIQTELPALSNNARWGNVEARVRQLANLQQYRDETGNPDWERLVRDAAYSELGPELQSARKESRDRRRDLQLNGQPSSNDEDTSAGSAGSANGSPNGSSRADGLRYALNSLRNGKTVDDVQSKLAKRFA